MCPKSQSSQKGTRKLVKLRACFEGAEYTRTLTASHASLASSDEAQAPRSAFRDFFTGFPGESVMDALMATGGRLWENNVSFGGSRVRPSLNTQMLGRGRRGTGV